MKNSHHLRLSAVLAGALALSSMISPAAAEERVAPIDPGFKPGTGQINPGVEQKAPSRSSEVTNIPTPEESRRALMTPISKQPSLGEMPNMPRAEVDTSTGPKERRESINAAGGPQGLTTAGSVPDSSAPNAGGQSAQATTGKGSFASDEPPPSGPIGSVGETIPAKFSKRNDILDRTPIMAWPLPLSDQQRRQIYEAVMADKTQPDASANALKPATQLSTNQALNEMHPLPESVRAIDGVTKLQYVKARDKVLLVEPSTRIVVEQITP